MKFIKKLLHCQRAVVLYLRIHVGRISEPILIYQMGKVASLSIYLSLKKFKSLHVFHLHCLDPGNIKRVKNEFHERGDSAPNLMKEKLLYKNYINQTKKTVKIISLVREPISRNLSAFFQNLQSFEGIKDAHDILDGKQLIDDFINKYNHEVPLNWFDVELLATTGIDVYQYPFDHKAGYQFINEPPYYVLILRHDLNDRLKEQYIKKFLNIDSLHISKFNVGSTKKYSEAYRNFLSSIQLPESYIDKMLLSKYARHFYSDEERQRFYEKWVEKKYDSNKTQIVS